MVMQLAQGHLVPRRAGCSIQTEDSYETGNISPNLHLILTLTPLHSAIHTVSITSRRGLTSSQEGMALSALRSPFTCIVSRNKTPNTCIPFRTQRKTGVGVPQGFQLTADQAMVGLPRGEEDPRLQPGAGSPFPELEWEPTGAHVAGGGTGAGHGKAAGGLRPGHLGSASPPANGPGPGGCYCLAAARAGAIQTLFSAWRKRKRKQRREPLSSGTLPAARKGSRAHWAGKAATVGSKEPAPQSCWQGLWFWAHGEGTHLAFTYSVTPRESRAQRSQSPPQSPPSLTLVIMKIP